MPPNISQENRDPAPRSSRAGSLVVEASTLRVGDRIEFSGAARRVWWPITGIEDKPKTRVITFDAGARPTPCHPGPQDDARRPGAPRERAMTPTETKTPRAVAACPEPRPGERRRGASAPSRVNHPPVA